MTARRLKAQSKLLREQSIKGYDTWSKEKYAQMNADALAGLHKGLPHWSQALRMKRIALEDEYYRRHGRDYR